MQVLAHFEAYDFEERKSTPKKGTLNAPLGLFQRTLYRTAYKPTLQPSQAFWYTHSGPLPKHTQAASIPPGLLPPLSFTA